MNLISPHMFQRLQKKWGVTAIQLFWIFCVFAITGTATAYLTRMVTSWVGLTENGFWLWRWLLRLCMLVIGYQVILLCVAALFGQLAFFWNYEKKILRRAGLLKKGRLPVHNTASVPVAIFATGGGSNAQQIINYFKNHPYIHIALVVSNKVEAGVLKVAQQNHIETLVLEKERFLNGDAYVPLFREKGIRFIVLAGFLLKIPPTLVRSYKGYILNIHPALLPRFGGKGMYGLHVHAAVIAAGEGQSGMTIHYVDEVYDHGDIVFQASCPVFPTDAPEDLAKRVLALEHTHYAPVIEQVIAQKMLV